MPRNPTQNDQRVEDFLRRAHDLQIHPSTRQIARGVGLSDRGVRLALKRLEDNGRIRLVEQVGGTGAGRYEITR
ncbi:MAG: winged helix-turn-helix transcriptional regulator [Acidobacteria bacterium]|nr:winged helix-turn-helix transcriptional regulator [Acidobacteriota bacterium]